MEPHRLDLDPIARAIEVVAAIKMDVQKLNLVQCNHELIHFHYCGQMYEFLGTISTKELGTIKHDDPKINLFFDLYHIQIESPVRIFFSCSDRRVTKAWCLDCNYTGNEAYYLEHLNRRRTIPL